MRKNFVIAVISVLATLGIGSAVFLGIQVHKVYQREVAQRKIIMKMRQKISNYEEVVDSIDNVHHHDYLMTLPCYRSLQVAQ